MIPRSRSGPAQFPIQSKSLPVPFDDRFGLHDGQCGSPVGPEPGEPHPEDAVAGPQPRAFDGLLEDSNLLSQGEVLGGGSSAADNKPPKEEKDRLDDAHTLSLPQLPNGQSYWDVSARTNDWRRNYARPATEPPTSDHRIFLGLRNRLC